MTIVFGVGFIFWPSIYVTTPVFFPFGAYMLDTTTWAQSIFHTNHYGWYVFAGYSTLVAAATTWITRKKIGG